MKCHWSGGIKEDKKIIVYADVESKIKRFGHQRYDNTGPGKLWIAQEKGICYYLFQDNGAP